jgi:predicted Rossmann fold nucleotide-binding protein DprA/Smf involved in DNA uptake
VSSFASGIDIAAHMATVDNNLITYACLGQGGKLFKLL